MSTTIPVNLDLTPDEIELLYVLVNSSNNNQKALLKERVATEKLEYLVGDVSNSLYGKVARSPGVQNLRKINKLLLNKR